MDFINLYITRPKKNVDEDLAEIVATFRELLKRGETRVKLINYHQGLPLCYPATIVGVENGMIDLDIHPQQAVAIQRDRYTFIRCDAFSHAIGAHVQYINVRKRAATLMRFFYADIMAEKRSALRLVLNPATDAAFETPEGKVSGKLIDLSTGGATVMTEHAPEIPERAEFKLQFMLPNIIQNTHTIAATPALYLGTTEQGGSYLIRCVITPDKNLEQQISQYLFQRQVEIIRDLKDESL
ncbi:MAG: PilZ domain-containing protein [Desulfuromonadaceae bacterium]|nr:PilZ domain-containing protein [Desulfuromonadaceae bacterium]